MRMFKLMQLLTVYKKLFYHPVFPGCFKQIGGMARMAAIFIATMNLIRAAGQYKGVI